MNTIKKISGRELARRINVVNRQIEENKRYGESLVDLLGKLVEEYHDRFINGGDLEGYKETLIVDDKEG